MSDNDGEIVHTGGCFCGAARYRVLGKPLLSAYCHCTLCQRLNAAAFICTTHWPTSRFTWLHDEPHNEAFDSYSVAEKPWKTRFRCKKCGCGIASYNSQANKWSVWGGQYDRDEQGKIIGWETIKPTAHIFYETRMVDVQDDLEKWTGYEGSSKKLS